MVEDNDGVCDVLIEVKPLSWRELSSGGQVEVLRVGEGVLLDVGADSENVVEERHHVLGVRVRRYVGDGCSVFGEEGHGIWFVDVKRMAFDKQNDRCMGEVVWYICFLMT